MDTANLLPLGKDVLEARERLGKKIVPQFIKMKGLRSVYIGVKGRQMCSLERRWIKTQMRKEND